MIWVAPQGSVPSLQSLGPVGLCMPKKQCFWHQHTKTSPFDDNPLFTIQNLCFHGAKATKISIFWYPQSPLQLQSSTAGAKISIFPWMWGMGGLGWWCQAASFAAKLVPRCQNTKPHLNILVPPKLPSSDADADAAADALQHSSAMVVLQKRVGGRASLINIYISLYMYIYIYIYMHKYTVDRYVLY